MIDGVRSKYRTPKMLKTLLIIHCIIRLYAHKNIFLTLIPDVWDKNELCGFIIELSRYLLSLLSRFDVSKRFRRGKKNHLILVLYISGRDVRVWYLFSLSFNCFQEELELNLDFR